MTTTALERTTDTAPTVTSDQLDLIRRTVAKDATPDELKLYLFDCARQGVHPLDKLIHFTKRSGKYTPITSIDFMRIQAAESGEYAGNDEPEFTYSNPAIPDAASVTVHRLVQGQRCAFTATARWREYYPGEGAPGFMWRRMPHVMLGKCAEALALRKGFPRQLAGLYAKEELDQADAPELPVVGSRDTPAADEGPDLQVDAPTGLHYLTDYKAEDGGWHSFVVPNWTLKGDPLRVSTRAPAVADAARHACEHRIPVKLDGNITLKKGTKGEAYLNKVETEDAF